MIDISTSKKISWIQFICSVIIITDHSFDYLDFGEMIRSRGGMVDNIFFFISHMLSTSLTRIAMPIFFLLSAFLLYKDWNTKKDIRDWYIRKIKGRVRSLVVPYFLWDLIWMIAFVAMGVIGVIDNNIDTTISIPNFFQGVVLAKYNEVFWFMQTLIIYVCISPLFGYAMSSRYRLVYLFICALLSTNVIPIRKILGGADLILNFYNLFFYCLGAYISIQWGEFVNRHYTKWQVAIAVPVLLLILVVLRCKYIGVWPIPDYIHMLVILLGAYLFWIICDPTKDLEIYTCVKCSFINYAMHKPVQQFYNKIVAMIFRPSWIGYLVNLYGGCCVTMMVIFVFVKVMLRAMPHTLEVLNGGRKIA